MKFLYFFVMLSVFMHAEFVGIITNINEVFKTITVNRMQYKIVRLTNIEKEDCYTNELKNIKFGDLIKGDLVEGKLSYNQGLSTISYMKVKCNKNLAF